MQQTSFVENGFSFQKIAKKKEKNFEDDNQ